MVTLVSMSPHAASAVQQTQLDIAVFCAAVCIVTLVLTVIALCVILRIDSRQSLVLFYLDTLMGRTRPRPTDDVPDAQVMTDEELDGEWDSLNDPDGWKR